MNLKGAILFGTGAIFALVSGYGAFTYIRAMEREVASTREAIAAFGEMARIPVPTENIARGGAITPADFRMMMIPSDSIPAKVIRELPQLPEGATSFTVFSDLQEGRMLLGSDIGLPSDRPNGLEISSDSRAMTLNPTNMDEVAPLLTLGAPVDVFWTETIGGVSQTRLLAPALRLVSISGEGDARSVLLEGRAEDAARYIQASGAGEFQILPSNGSRDLSGPEVVVGMNDLSSLPLVVREGAGFNPEFMQQISGEPTCTLSVIRSADRSVVEVPC